MQLIERNGVYYARGKINGVRYRVSTKFRVSGKAAKSAAQRRMAEIEVEIRGGERGWTTKCPTVSEWWDTYRTTTLRQTAPTTQRRYTEIATRSLLPMLGTLRLDAVKKADCLRYLETRRAALCANPGHKNPRQVSEGTVQKERRFLQAFFQEAIANSHLEKNPWQGIERVTDKVRERVLTDAEERELLSRLRPRYQRFVKVLVGTGLRLEELRTINPKTDIYWRRRLVTVTGKGSKIRQVPLTSTVAQHLKDQLTEDGCLWTQNQQRFRAVLKGACEARDGRRELPHLSPHALRHTFGWRYLRGGGDIYSLSKILGHASVVVTEKHYASLLKEDLVAKMDRVDFGAVSAELPPTEAAASPAPQTGALPDVQSCPPAALYQVYPRTGTRS